jgi:CubicO group peptidase (beta-lactamase class C family)
MRKTFILRAVFRLLASALVAGIASGQAAPISVAGEYTGTLGNMHLRLHVHQDSAGNLSGTLDSIDDGDNGLLCDHFLRSGYQFSFSVPSEGGTYHGEIARDGKMITGIWKQGPPTPLIFTREERPAAVSLGGQLKEIDAIVSASFADDHVGSVTVGVVSGSELIWTKSYGYADMEQHQAADKDTVYRVGSITKMFTAVMLEQLADDGKVHLSDPANRYFPQIDLVLDRPPGAVPVTLFELATHTSGLDMEPDNEEKYDHGPVADWQKILISSLPHVHYVFEPGTKASYSNVGYAILGAALSQAAAQPYVEYLPAHIFQPLGMAHTTLEFTPVVQSHLAKGYVVKQGTLDVRPRLPGAEWGDLHNGRRPCSVHGSAFGRWSRQCPESCQRRTVYERISGIGQRTACLRIWFRIRSDAPRSIYRSRAQWRGRGLQIGPLHEPRQTPRRNRAVQRYRKRFGQPARSRVEIAGCPVQSVSLSEPPRASVVAVMASSTPGWTRGRRREMSQTWKDLARQSTHRIVLEVATNGDGTYEIIFNERVVGSRIPERWLDDELCAKRGFCHEELASIKRQLEEWSSSGGSVIRRGVSIPRTVCEFEFLVCQVANEGISRIIVA